MAELRFEVGAPSDGWTTVTLEGGEARWTVDASSIFDALTELVYAGLELAEDRPVREVAFLEEPALSVLTFTPIGSLVRLTVFRYADTDRRGGVVRFEAVAPRRAVIRAIWAALRRLEGAVGRAEIERGWRPNFPSREVEQLGVYARVTGPAT